MSREMLILQKTARLVAPELAVYAACGDKFLMGSLLYYLAAIKNNDAVHAAQGGKPVRYRDDRFSFH